MPLFVEHDLCRVDMFPSGAGSGEEVMKTHLHLMEVDNLTEVDLRFIIPKKSIQLAYA